MLRNRVGRRVMAAFGGVLILSGVGTTGAAMAADYSATLNGDTLVPAGDTDGWGRAKVNVDGTLNRVCIDLEVRDIGQVTSATLYRGADGEKGAPVMALDRPDGQDQDEDDCDHVGDTITDEIQANPAGFYVLIATADHPEGALRGQLAPSAD